ncbi:MAG: diguanylate cyclase [Calditrichaeota bacterium]|nr:MAG: diguanylate cyclase [Calditrichota bacterium]
MGAIKDDPGGISTSMGLKRAKILYIEDDRASRLLVKQLLESAGFQVLEAENGLRGLEMARREQPDLILMDINLPDISGTELTTKIKNTPALENITVVALSALKGEENRQIFLVAGCDGFIQKPIDRDRFAEQIQEFLAGKREKIPTSSQELVRRRYEKTLVDRLTNKVEELQRSNQLLQELTQTLQDYNAKLERLHHIVLALQMCHSAEQLKADLYHNICQNFAISRCAFLEIDPEHNQLVPRHFCGIDPHVLKKLQIPYQEKRFEQLFQESQVVVIEKPEQIAETAIREQLKQTESFPFIFGMLGIPNQKPENLLDPETVQEMLRIMGKQLGEEVPITQEVLRDHVQQYLTPEMFRPGGFLYIDLKSVPEKARQHTVQLLEMLLRTASLIYNNLLLRIQLRQLFIHAETEAITDPLTGLYNFRYLMLQLEREVQRSRRHNSPLALLMIDIDFFKAYNDTFGHPAGNKILQKLAQLLQENTRGTDIVARYGGEEFVVICPELDRTGALKLAEKIRRIVAQTPFEFEKQLPHQNLTVSIGVAAFPQDGKTARALIRAADVAMYSAKKAGRNRVQGFSPASS